MESDVDKKQDFSIKESEEIYSKAVRAGKRTYFFDVKATKFNELYLTVTESKRKQNQDGSFYFEKHKIFLYKEDFEKFLDGINEAIDYIKTANPIIIKPAENQLDYPEEQFVSIDFEDLDTKM
ncbi:MAG TPA: DUF3276 family protein [Bacteroidales bacterium]|nr:DUF3276 family protein [Bacteroidales bacterium]